MNVLYVTNGLGTGGSERSLAEMFPLLVSSGINPSVVCFYRRGEGVEQAVIDQGVAVRFISERGLLPRVRALRRIIVSERPDLIHTVIFESNLAGRLAAAGIRTPLLTSLVTIPYGPVRLRDPHIQRLKLRFAQFIDGATARLLSAHFHAITGAVKTAAIRDLGVPAHRITVIERGRDPVRLGLPGVERRNRVRMRLGLRDDDEVIVNVARQEFQKGQSYLVSAMGTLMPARPRLILLVAGRAGGATANLEDIQKRAGLGPRIRFLGHREDVPDILAAADLFVFPSVLEGLGCALIEAMALGLPLVASDIDAIREVVEEGGNALLVPPGDPSALAAAIERLLDNRDMAAAFARRSRGIFEQRFTLDRSVQRMISLYRDVATARRTDKPPILSTEA